MATTPTVYVHDGPEQNQRRDHPSKDFGFLPIPKRLRYDPDKPFHFGLVMNISFGFTSTFIVANLYYCQPLLIDLAKSFEVSYEGVSRIPTLIQVGYAVGLLLISPLGDLVRRRQLMLLLISLSSTLTIGLSITKSLRAFEALSFLVGCVSVVPQILLPLAADLAPPERRASAISIVLAGLVLGILIARVLAGVIANFTTWRVVYYMATGVQYLALVLAYWILPDCPAKTQDLTYFNILTSMAKYAFTEPKVIQAAIVNMASSACFSGFWVTLTFLLGGPPYNYSTLVIGLFGLIGMLGVAAGPFVGIIVDRLVPWYAALFATVFQLLFQAVETGAGGINIAAVIVACFGLDVFRQMQQVSLTSSVFTISVAARARLNAILILAIFIGQVIGTSVCTNVFVQSGWRAAAAVQLALFGLQTIVLLVRGPHVERYTWFGYEGGLEARKSVVTAREKERAENKVTAVPEKEKGARTDNQLTDKSLSLDATLEGGIAEKDPSQFA